MTDRSLTHATLSLERVYIVPDERIVYASALHAGETLATVSLTTVEFTREGDGTRLTLTQQGTFLDGHEEPAWREQ
ncbi:MAG TPA: SRPBCC domain-containing protein, partial [Actinomadura sp.]|nr:SRPBCC domain-containing protein [Actinomadura sp.]